jgi:hypothetical protein
VVGAILDGVIRFRGPLDSLRARTGEPSLERALASLIVLPLPPLFLSLGGTSSTDASIFDHG